MELVGSVTRSFFRNSARMNSVSPHKRLYEGDITPIQVKKLRLGEVKPLVGSP